jgi:hypothetical protein
MVITQEPQASKPDHSVVLLHLLLLHAVEDPGIGQKEEKKCEAKLGGLSSSRLLLLWKHEGNTKPG